MSRRARQWSDRDPSGFEPLETRNLQSHLAPGGHGGGGRVAAEVLPKVAAATFGGAVHGPLHRVQGSPDVGASAGFVASGHLAGLGAVRVSGTIWGTGNIVGGQPSGQIFVSDGQGTTTLSLLGPGSPSFTAPRSGVYSYATIDGSGDQSGLSSRGTVAITLGPKTIALAFAPSKG